MRFLTALTAALLPFTALAAKKPSADRFTNYRQQQLSAGSAIKLNDDIYSDLTKAPRDYSVAVLLTALETRFGCVLCQEFQPEWNLLAKSWSKGDKDGQSRLVFGTLDFANGQKTFQSVRFTFGCHTNAIHILTTCTDDASNRSCPPSFPSYHRCRRQARWSPCPL